MPPASTGCSYVDAQGGIVSFPYHDGSVLRARTAVSVIAQASTAPSAAAPATRTASSMPVQVDCGRQHRRHRARHSRMRRDGRWVSAGLCLVWEGVSFVWLCLVDTHPGLGRPRCRRVRSSSDHDTARSPAAPPPTSPQPSRESRVQAVRQRRPKHRFGAGVRMGGGVPAAASQTQGPCDSPHITRHTPHIR